MLLVRVRQFRQFASVARFREEARNDDEVRRLAQRKADDEAARAQSMYESALTQFLRSMEAAGNPGIAKIDQREYKSKRGWFEKQKNGPWYSVVKTFHGWKLSSEHSSADGPNPALIWCAVATDRTWLAGTNAVSEPADAPQTESEAQRRIDLLAKKLVELGAEPNE